MEHNAKQGATVHVTRNDTIEQLTDQVMNWYGFTNAYDYAFRPYAMLIAIELDNRKARPDTLTKEQIEGADETTGGRMQEMWETINQATNQTGTRIAPEDVNAS